MALGTWTTGFASGSNVTVPSGTGRIAVVVFTLNFTTAPTSIACTLGGVSMTALTPIVSATSAIYAWYLLDAALPATGSRAVVTTITGGSGLASGWRAYSCADARDQVAPAMAGVANGSNQATVTGGPLTVAADDYGYAVSVGDASLGSWTQSSAIGATYTERWDDSASRSGGSDTTYASGGTETVTFTNTVSTNRLCGALIRVPAVPAPPPTAGHIRLLFRAP
jgi:hypothetical protein